MEETSRPIKVVVVEVFFYPFCSWLPSANLFQLQLNWNSSAICFELYSSKEAVSFFKYWFPTKKSLEHLLHIDTTRILYKTVSIIPPGNSGHGKGGMKNDGTRLLFTMRKRNVDDDRETKSTGCFRNCYVCWLPTKQHGKKILFLRQQNIQKFKRKTPHADCFRWGTSSRTYYGRCEAFSRGSQHWPTP